MYYFNELCPPRLLWNTVHACECACVLQYLSQVEEGDRETRICLVGPSFLTRVEELHISDLSSA